MATVTTYKPDPWLLCRPVQPNPLPQQVFSAPWLHPASGSMPACPSLLLVAASLKSGACLCGDEMGWAAAEIRVHFARCFGIASWEVETRSREAFEMSLRVAGVPKQNSSGSFLIATVSPVSSVHFFHSSPVLALTMTPLSRSGTYVYCTYIGSTATQLNNRTP